MFGDRSGRPIARSVSNSLFFSNPHNFAFQRNPSRSSESLPAVHLITCDLWEAITGERLSPTHICQLLSHSMPTYDYHQSAAPSLQAGQFVPMAKDRAGSRALQHRIESSGPAEVAVIFDSLLPSRARLRSGGEFRHSEAMRSHHSHTA
jgi:hypothetical protein